LLLLDYSFLFVLFVSFLYLKCVFFSVVVMFACIALWESNFLKALFKINVLFYSILFYSILFYESLEVTRGFLRRTIWEAGDLNRNSVCSPFNIFEQQLRWQWDLFVIFCPAVRSASLCVISSLAWWKRQ